MRALSPAVLASALAISSLGCPRPDPSADAGDPRLWRRASPLPTPLTNNAVAAIDADGVCTLYSAMGIDQTLTPAGIVNRAYQWHEGAQTWLPLPDVPSDVGRVAASAAALGHTLYVLGGYSVEEDGTALSFGAMHAYDTIAAQWSTTPPLPVHVADPVALAWGDRWLVAVGGWSNTEPVGAVQIYDAQTQTWADATPFPGTPVFGHAGALVGDQLVVIDGATPSADGFELVNQAWLATLDPDQPATLVWEDLGPHPGPARYRAAGGPAWGQLAWFQGGADVPFGYDGVAYAAGAQAQPIPSTLVFDFGSRSFAIHDKDKPIATMDHSALATCGGRMYTVGGLVEGPEVTAEVWVYTY